MTGRKNSSRYHEFYRCVEALERYETWFHKVTPQECIRTRSAMHMFAKRHLEDREYTGLCVDDGLLVVRTR